MDMTPEPASITSAATTSNHHVESSSSSSRQSIMEEINSITFNNNNNNNYNNHHNEGSATTTTTTTSTITNFQQNEIIKDFEMIEFTKVKQEDPLLLSLNQKDENSILSELTSQQQQQQQQQLQRQKHSFSSLDGQLEALSEYCYRQSSQEPHYLTTLRANTATVFPSGVHMVSGPLQGRLLSLLVSISKSKKVLELGTFTGYSALCLAEGLPNDVESTIITCEQDERSLKLAETAFLQAPKHLRNKISTRLGTASEILAQFRRENKSFDFVFIDADKKAYISYLTQLIGRSPISDTTTTTTTGTTSDHGAAERDDINNTVTTTNELSLLEDGALIVVDNVLWKGLVLTQEEDLAIYAPNPEDYGNQTRMLNLAKTMHTFNQYVTNSNHFQVVMLPLRDGLSILKYSKNGFEKK